MGTIQTAPPPISPSWIELPYDLTLNILQRLRAEEILESVQKVCTTWWRVSKNPVMWRVIDLDSRNCLTNKFDNLCRRAVDRSQGQLVELRLDGNYVTGLLNYTADRSSQLRCLSLVDYYTIETALVEAIKKLPPLEELHLILRPTLKLKDFETIGIFCPYLKSFTYSDLWTSNGEFTERAVAIGKTMPNLRHLRLFSDGMEDKGLEAILDGCPRLELLDLNGDSGLDLQGPLAKRCYDQIKDLTLDFSNWRREPFQRHDYWDDSDD